MPKGEKYRLEFRKRGDTYLLSKTWYKEREYNEIAELNKMQKEGKITEMEYARMKYKIINWQ